MNTSVVRPLVDQLYSTFDVSVGMLFSELFLESSPPLTSTVYCLLVNRVQFLREQSVQGHHHTVSTTRARLCELVASRILRRFDEDNPGPEGLLPLANVLVSGFAPFQNAPQHIVEEYKNTLHSASRNYRRSITALELAIISDSKMFLSSASCQKVMEAIYVGRVVYTPTTYFDMLPDHYKHKRILLYNPRKAPLLDHYRLRVPRTRNALGVLQFMILLLLYILVMQSRDDVQPLNIPAVEILFCIYSLGWILEQVASMLEHGWQVYTQNLWSFLDVTFTAIYVIYFAERTRGHIYQDEELMRQSMDILSMAAPVLIPRLAFNLLSENMLFISLRDMMVNFAILTFLAVWCFLGFFLSMNWMSQGDPKPYEISKWMLWIWFGLDGTGIQRSAEFHWFLGPLLMVMFAFLGNTLFLTILVSMLSSTFANIVNNANAEIQYRRSVMTFEGVKSDAIFFFMPPFNILALCGLLPLQLLLSPRWFHKVVVFSTRALNAPILLSIGLYERQAFGVLEGIKQERQEGIVGSQTFPDLLYMQIYRWCLKLSLHSRSWKLPDRMME